MLFLLCFLISRSSSFSVIHVKVDIKIKLQERISFVFVIFFISKSPGGYAIYRGNMRVYLKCKIPPCLHEWVDVRNYVYGLFSHNQNFLDAWITKFRNLWCFASHASRARDFGYY